MTMNQESLQQGRIHRGGRLHRTGHTAVALAQITGFQALQVAWAKRLQEAGDIASLPLDATSQACAPVWSRVSVSLSHRIAAGVGGSLAGTLRLIAAVAVAVQARCRAVTCLAANVRVEPAGGSHRPELILLLIKRAHEPTLGEAYEAVRIAFAEACSSRRASRTLLAQRKASDTRTSEIPVAALVSQDDFPDDRAEAPSWPLAFRGADGKLVVDYRADLLQPGTVESITQHVEAALHALLHAPSTKVGELTYPNMRTARAMLRGLSAQHSNESVSSRFRRVAADLPQQVALIHRGHEVRYGELAGSVSRMSNGLLACGIGPGDVVALRVSAGVHLVALVLAVHEVGAKYVALDPAYPEARSREILAELQAAALIGDTNDSEGFARHARCYRVQDLESAAPVSGASLHGRAQDPDGEFAILFTSSTTGRPKGVRLRETSLVSRLEWMWRRFPFVPGETVLLQKPLALVGVLWELYGGLLAGVPTLIVDPEDVRDSRQLLRLLAQHDVSRIAGSPPLFESLLAVVGDTGTILPKMRVAYSSADILSAQMVGEVRRIFPSARILNLYGSTECTSNALCYEVPDRDLVGDRVPVGTPIDNVSAFIVDETLKEVAPGAVGELCIAGACVSAGYMGESAGHGAFVPNPFEVHAARGDVLYRTGDLARQRHDGAIELLGRRDSVVKVRGFRVELGEIERIVSLFPGVKEAAAHVDAGAGGRTRLYAVFSSGPEVSAVMIREFLAQRLPKFMMPTRLLRIPGVPKTRAGKVDRARLLEAILTANAATLANRTINGSVEEVICAISAEIADLHRFDGDDRFMDKGINSLGLIELREALHRELGQDISVASIFQFPTPRTLAAHLSSGTRPESNDQGVDARDRAAKRHGVFAARRRSTGIPVDR